MMKVVAMVRTATIAAFGAVASLTLGGCEATKSVEYYVEHEGEARAQIDDCNLNAAAGENCSHAMTAIRQIEEQRFRDNQAKTKKAIEDGSLWPTIKGQ